MDYVATCPDVYVVFCACDVVLHIDSDAACLLMPKAKSYMSGYYHLSDHPDKKFPPELNDTILVTCNTVRHVVTSSAESETACIFIND